MNPYLWVFCTKGKKLFREGVGVLSPHLTGRPEGADTHHRHGQQDGGHVPPALAKEGQRTAGEGGQR